MRLDEAALCFGYNGHNIIPCTEGVSHISVYCYDAARTGHFKFCEGVEWDRIKSSKNGMPQKCMVATVERGNVKGQALTSEVVCRTENDFQCDRAHAVSFYAGYCSREDCCSGFDSGRINAHFADSVLVE